MTCRTFVKATGGFLLLNGLIHNAKAVETPAGTIIQSTSTISYTIGGGPVKVVTSPVAAFTVAQLLDVAMTWQDAAPVAVTSPGSNNALTFQLTNTGNGPETLSLTRNNALAGDNYDPSNGSVGAIFLESGAQPGFQATGPNADIAYVPGSNDPTLAANASRIVYVISNTPAAQPSGSTGNVALSAASTLAGAAGAAPGTTLAGKGAGGVDAVVGSSRAQASQIGSYRVGGVQVSVVKTVLGAADALGGSTISSGTVVTYRIVVSATGVGTAQGLSVTDPIPANMSYVANSILVDGSARSDAADGDNAAFQNGSVQAQFGDTIAPASHTVQFRVTIN
jgi:uncharacterized repeat protein (TIGR01451 family)